MNLAYRPRRRVTIRIHLDANRINARGGLSGVNQLEKWHDDEVIELHMSAVAQEEAAQGGNSARREKALAYIFSETRAGSQEQDDIAHVEHVLGEGMPLDANTRRDAEIVFNAQKYSAVLVTADRRILRNRARLAATIMTDTEAVAHVRAKIQERDRLCRELADHFNEALPEWVGQD